MFFKKIIHSLKPKKRSSRNSSTVSWQRNLFDTELKNKSSYKTHRKKIVPKKFLFIFEKIKGKETLYFSLLWIWIIISLSIFLLFGPFLNLKNIYINHDNSIINVNQAYASIEYIRGENILLLDTASIASRLRANQNTIKNIDIKVSFPSTLTIELSPYKPVFQTPWYIILENGSIITQEKEDNINIPSIILSKDIAELEVFWKKLNVSELQKIITIINETEKNILNFWVEKIIYFISEKEVLISNNLETVFIFDLTANIFEQVERLSIFQKEWGNISEKKYIYVDARIPQKLFICPYESEFSCRTSLRNIYDDAIFTKLQKDVSQPEQ